MALLYFDDERRAARAVARVAGVRAAPILRHRFPDGELKLTLPRRLPRRVVLFRSLHQPNEKLVEVWLAARAARALGAVTVTLMAPYLPYMRQDRAFAPGEAVSQQHIGAMLGAVADRVVTVDPHLHRVASLDEVVPGAETLALSAAPSIGAFLRRHARGALLVGPDEESGQWVGSAAEAAGLAWTVARKVRRGDRQVAVSLPDVNVHRRHVVLVDDMISTGRTLAQAARLLVRAGASRVDVAATHALFADDALVALRSSGIGRIWTTDTVPHETNTIRLAGLLGEALRD